MSGQVIPISLIDSDSTVTIVPGFDKLPDHFARFRWNMQIPLPYPFPSRTCVCKDVTVADKPFSFQIHNHYDRVFQTIRSPESGATRVRTFMHDKRKPGPAVPPGCIGMSRQPLQSVVFFDGQADYPTGSEAVADAGPMMNACVEY